MKILELRAILEKGRLDFAFFYNLDSSWKNPNVAYFSGYDGLSVAIIPRKKEPFLVVPKMELERAQKSSRINVYSMDKKRLLESVKAILAKKSIKSRKIAIDGQHFSLDFYRNFKKRIKGKTADISLECLRLRETKTEKERRTIKKGFWHADAILKRAINCIKIFKTEADAAAFLEYESKRLGLGISFDPIVASGKNASMPHHKPKNDKLRKGFCVLDFGIKYKNYCTDITRTIYLGNPTAKEKAIYSFLLKIQNNIVNNVKIGDDCSRLYENCVKSMQGYSRYFTHGLGHGVGIEIHELPNLSLNSKDRIRENTVFTVEPGIYIPGKLGIRIEDTILMKNKPNVLTKLAKDLLIV